MRIVASFPFASLALALVLALAPPARAHDGDHAAHAFVVLGEGDVHLYHLARFDSPHRWQALLRVALATSDGTPLDLAREPNARPDRLFGLLSTEPFLLADLGRGAVRSFHADLYEGYLRDTVGRRLVRPDVVVRVEAVERFEELHAEAARAAEYEMISTCDTTTGTFYAAHRIDAKPSFEQIVSLRALYFGDPSEDVPSVVYPCESRHFGADLTLVEPAAGNRPLARDDLWRAWLVRSAVLGGVVGAAPQASVLVDTEAVNR
jgi:hypothetical protein